VEDRRPIFRFRPASRLEFCKPSCIRGVIEREMRHLQGGRDANRAADGDRIGATNPPIEGYLASRLLADHREGKVDVSASRVAVGANRFVCFLHQGLRFRSG
jgi:hypothetical protein